MSEMGLDNFGNLLRPQNRDTKVMGAPHKRLRAFVSFPSKGFSSSLLAPVGFDILNFLVTLRNNRYFFSAALLFEIGAFSGLITVC